MKRTFALSSIVVIAGFSTLGCAKTVDSADLEAKVKTEGTAKGVPIKSVACPAGKPMKAGETFECTTTLEDGQTTRTSIDLGDGTGQVKWEHHDLVDTKAITDAIMGGTPGLTEAKCPHAPILVAKAGEKVDCTAIGREDRVKHVFEVAIEKSGKFTAKPKD